MGRAFTGLALVVVAIVLGVAFFGGHLGTYIVAAQERILRPEAKPPKVTVPGPGGRSHLS